MRISAIRNYERPCCPRKMVRRNNVDVPQTKEQSDTLAFKGKQTVKGIGIGTAIGLGALTLISGGAAAPIAYGVYAVASGTVGGMLGNILDEAKKEEEESKKDDE